MFSSRKAVVLDRYQRRRTRRVLPRWLVLLLLGVAIGAGGVVFVQERYLPPRLSADASARLQSSFDQADAARLRLERDGAQAAKRLESAEAERKRLGDALAAERSALGSMRSDLDALVGSLPPDPRKGVVAVRAARFVVDHGSLAYHVVISSEQTGRKPLNGVMQLVVAGVSERGSSGATVSPQPVPISVDGYESVHGSVPLPPGFKPRQTTVHVFDRIGGKLLGMRVMNVS